MQTANVDRWIRQAIFIEYFLVIYNIVEATLSVFSGIRAESVALIGFGLDSLIEVTAAVMLIWRLNRFGQGGSMEESKRERKTLRVVAITFFLLAAFVSIESIRTLWLQEPPSPSTMGLIIALLSIIIMPGLVIAKKHLAKNLQSRALAAEANETLVCAALSVILLLGLGVNALWGWWWADPMAALGMVYFIIKEGREAWEEASSKD